MLGDVNMTCCVVCYSVKLITLNTSTEVDIVTGSPSNPIPD